MKQNLIVLRDYQQAAVKAVIDCWKRARTCLIVLPTGCGKTIVVAELIRRIVSGEVVVDPHRVMMLAHRLELVNQAERKIAEVAQCTVDIEMGDRQAFAMFNNWPRVIISSVQTQSTGRMNKFDPNEFGALVIDEAHHATSRTYRNCIDHYLKNPNCRLLGVTATPDRGDSCALGNVFEEVAYEYTMQEAIDDGWLVPVRQKLVQVSSLDYSAVTANSGDFNQAELAEVLEEERNLHGIAAPTIEICGQRRAIIFATSVKQAERLSEIINRSAPGKAAWICGRTNPDERRQTLEDFASGKLQFIVNVGVLTEGFDDAGVEVIVMARPTKSRALYAQMAGRATRPAAEIATRLGELGSESDELGTEEDSAIHNSKLKPLTSAAARRRALIAASSKPSCLIVDFVGNAGRHKLVTTLDLLGGKTLTDEDEEVQALVRERCTKAEDGLDVQEAIEQVCEEVKARKLAAAKERAFIQLKAKYKVTSVDPFSVYDLPPPPPDARAAFDKRRLSEAQRNIIRMKVGENPDTLSYAQGRALVNSYFRRRERGLATLKQTRFLRRHGVTMPMTFNEASATIGRLMGRRV